MQYADGQSERDVVRKRRGWYNQADANSRLGVVAMNLPDFLTEHAYGSIRITGHRIGLLHIVRHYNDGYSPEMLQCEFPTLSLALIHKVIAFYLENKEEVDAYVARCEEEIERHRAATPPGPSTEELRRRLEAMRKAGA